jgi:hypothetical protein
MIEKYIDLILLIPVIILMIIAFMVNTAFYYGLCSGIILLSATMNIKARL